MPIRFDADAGRVRLVGRLGENTFATNVVLTRRDARRVELNGERLGSSERLRHELTTLVFTPDRLAVVKGGPATRRAYLDRVVGRLLPARATIANDYLSAVSDSATRAFAACVRGGISTRDALAPWTAKVVRVRRRARAGASRRDRLPLTPLRGERRRARPPRRRRCATKASRRRRRSLRVGSTSTWSAGRPARAPTFTTSASRPASTTCGRSARKGSSGWLCSHSSSRRPTHSRERLRRVAARPARRCPVRARRRPTPRAGTHPRAGRTDGRHGNGCRRPPRGADTGTLCRSGCGAVMERIGRTVERELARGGSRDAIPARRPDSAWPAVVGDAVARHAWPLRIARDGTLHVATASATWAQELAFLSPTRSSRAFVSTSDPKHRRG